MTYDLNIDGDVSVFVVELNNYGEIQGTQAVFSSARAAQVFVNQYKRMTDDVLFITEFIVDQP